MTPVILYRPEFHSHKDDELEIAKKYFPVYECRTEVPKGSTVVCRYSALPFYRELQRDLQNLGSQLLQPYEAHRWIADFEYYEDLKDYTFPSWTENQYPYCGYDGPVVVKGTTNSKKFQWNKKMFAKDRRTASEIMGDLLNDGLIGTQGIIFRQYVPLKKLDEGINGLPFTNEFRFFMFKEEILSYGYYWSIADNIKDASLNDDAFELIKVVSKICSQYVDFYVIDIAEREEGGWIVVELNDGFMSGLSENDPDILYGNLRKCVDNKRSF